MMNRLFRIVALWLMLVSPALASQATLVTPGSPLPMTALAAFLNSAFLSIGSCNSGNTAPVNGTGGAAFAGECWINTSSNPWVFSYTADGSHWSEFGTLNTSTYVWTSYSGGTVLSPGVSVLNPGTGTLEDVLPPQTVTGVSKTFATADLFKKTRRSNSGSAMSDTFPASSATGLVNGTRIVVANVDATAVLTITAGSGTIMSQGTSTDTVGPGRDVAYEYDLSTTQWRRAYNTGTALLGPNNLSDLSSPSTARTNLGVAIGANVEAWSANLDALAALSGTNTIYYRSAANTWTPVTFGVSMGFASGAISRSALTGDVSAGADSNTTVLNNIPAGVTMAGWLLASNIAAPSTPATGKVSVWTDSTDLRFHDKNAAGTIGTTVVPDTGATNNFLTSISPAGVINKARPACANLSDASVFCNGTSAASLTGTLQAGQFPALSGDVSTTAGSLATLLATVNSNVGSFGSSTAIPNFTVDAKGRLTAAGTSVVIAPAGTLTGTSLPSGVVTSFLTSVGVLTGGSASTGFTIALNLVTLTSTLPPANFPAATATAFGGVKPDGTTLNNSSGAISVNYGTGANTAAQGNDTRIVNAVQNSTTVTAGCGLSGGGALSSNLTLSLSLTINAQTGTSYTVQNSDCGKLISLNNPSAVAVSLPQANGSTFVSGWSVDFQNKGAGAVTITPVTSTINGGASVALAQNQGMHCDSDGSNYTCVLGVGAGGGSGTVTSVSAGACLSGGPITASGTLAFNPTCQRSYLAGLTLSTAGSSSTFGVATGVANDNTNVSVMLLASAYTKTTAAWTVGTGNGGLDTGTIAASTWYHVFLMERLDTGVVDICVSVTVTSCTTGGNIPAAYTLFRRIGSMKTDGSSHWLAFFQLGNEFVWVTTPNDMNGAVSTTGGNLLVLSVPPGINVAAKMRFLWYNSASGQPLFLMNPNYGSAATGNYFLATSGAYLSGETVILSNTNSQIVAYAAASGILQIATVGWTDTRGREL